MLTQQAKTTGERQTDKYNGTGKKSESVVREWRRRAGPVPTDGS